MTPLLRTFADFLKTAPGQSAVAEVEQNNLDQRLELVAELETVNAAEIEAVPGLKAAHAEAVAQTKTARKALEAAEEAQRIAKVAWSNLTHRTEAQRDRLQTRLHRTAAPEIAVFIVETRDEYDATCDTPVTGHDVGLERGMGTLMAIAGKHYSNLPAIRARLAAIRAAREEAEAMKLEALPIDEVTAGLEALRSGLPDASVETMTVDYSK